MFDGWRKRKWMAKEHASHKNVEIGSGIIYDFEPEPHPRALKKHKHRHKTIDTTKEI